MDNRYADLMQQGFMRPTKRQVSKRSGEVRANEIAKQTGQEVEWRNGRYALRHPKGHTNFISTYKEAMKLAQLQAKG